MTTHLELGQQHAGERVVATAAVQVGVMATRDLGRGWEGRQAVIIHYYRFSAINISESSNTIRLALALFNFDFVFLIESEFIFYNK